MPTVSGGLQIAVSAESTSGATATNVLNFVNIGGDFEESATDVLVGAWIDYAKQFMADTWDVGGAYRALDLSTDPRDEVLGSVAPEAGVNGADSNPPNVAICVSLSTGASGRSRRGRIYLAGAPVDLVLPSGGIESVGRVAMETEFVDYGQGCAVVGWIPAVYSRKLSQVNAAIGVSVSSFADTQRRRISRLES